MAAVFEVHSAHLVRLAWALVGDPTEAEDVVMDAFAGLERRWAYVRRIDDASFNLRTSVVNGSRSRLRRLRVSRAKSHILADLDGAPAQQIAMLHLEHQLVVLALRGLPRRQREVLVLRYYEEATEAEIEETLGISAGSVKTHASRGLHAVADLLEGSARAPASSSAWSAWSDSSAPACTRSTRWRSTFRVAGRGWRRT